MAPRRAGTSRHAYRCKAGYMINLFCGYDYRESIGWHVFVASVLARTSRPVAIYRLDSCGLPQGSNAFSLSRFMVPALMEFHGRAIFADGADMLMQADIAELDALFDATKAVQVVKQGQYRTRHKIKYIGTSMQCPNVDLHLAGICFGSLSVSTYCGCIWREVIFWFLLSQHLLCPHLAGGLFLDPFQ